MSGKMTAVNGPPAPDSAIAALGNVKTLTELVGREAVIHIQRRSRYALAGIVASMCLALPLLVLAERASGSAGNAAGAGAMLAYLVSAILFVLSFHANRQAGRLASEVLSARLGVPVRPAVFNTVVGWRTHLLREYDDFLTGRKRPFFYIRINKPL